MCTIHQNTKLLVDAFSGNINGCMRRINRAAAGDANGEEVEKFEVTYRDKGGTIPFFPKLAFFFCTCHNFSPLSSVQIIIIPACCLLCVL